MKALRKPSSTSASNPADKPAVATPKLPHERDQSSGSVGTEPRKVIQQAYKDLQSGLVDTDMRATPGLDAQRRKKLVKPATK